LLPTYTGNSLSADEWTLDRQQALLRRSSTNQRRVAKAGTHAWDTHGMKGMRKRYAFRRGGYTATQLHFTRRPTGGCDTQRGAAQPLLPCVDCRSGGEMKIVHAGHGLELPFFPFLVVDWSHRTHTRAVSSRPMAPFGIPGNRFPSLTGYGAFHSSSIHSLLRPLRPPTSRVCPILGSRCPPIFQLQTRKSLPFLSPTTYAREQHFLSFPWQAASTLSHCRLFCHT